MDELLDGDQPDALFRQGLTLYQRRRYAEARDHFNRALERDPARGEAWAFRALSRILLPEPNLPLDDLNQALSLLSPPSDEGSRKLRFLLLTFRAAALHQAGQYEQTVVDLISARALGSLDAHDLLRLGASYRNLGRLEQAIDAYHQALGDAEHERVSPDILLEVAQALMELGDSPTAIAATQIVLDQQPENGLAWTKQSRALLALTRYHESLESAEHALALGGDEYFLWGVKATALRGLNRFEEARTAYHRAYLLAPNPEARAPAFHGEVRMLLRLRRWNSARRLLVAELEQRLSERRASR